MFVKGKHVNRNEILLVFGGAKYCSQISSERGESCHSIGTQMQFEIDTIDEHLNEATI
jgi:hypothetical protein